MTKSSMLTFHITRGILNYQGRLAYEQCQALPVEWIHEDRQLLEKSAEIKATHNLSLADAWISASALLSDSIFVHKDPEFKALDCDQFFLPFIARAKKD